MHLERLNINTVDWQHLATFGDRTLYQSLPWLNFIAATQQAELVIAALREGGETLGYFTGAIVRKFGLPLLGSPFPGWTTSYLGFNLQPGVAREQALSALADFAFRDLKCLHVEVMDRYLTEDEARKAGFTVSYLKGFEVDLAPSEDVILARLKDDCRWRIRKAQRSGVVIEEATDPGFADDYYAQLEDVFAKRRLTPTYDRARVRALIEHLLPAGQILLLRARDPEGRCIATGIFPAACGTAYYWGGASWRAHQSLSPNEAIQWHAMRYWKARGMTRYDMCGGGAYKAKYGGQPISVPWVRKSRFEFLARQRDLFKKLYWLMHRLAGRGKR
jgi:CelD/BcsL family acetyltransferase involved in cellulose biosynthesis